MSQKKDRSNVYYVHDKMDTGEYIDLSPKDMASKKTPECLTLENICNEEKSSPISMSVKKLAQCNRKFVIIGLTIGAIVVAVSLILILFSTVGQSKETISGQSKEIMSPGK